MISTGSLLEYSISGGISEFLNQSLHCNRILSDPCSLRNITILHISAHRWPVQGRRARSTSPPSAPNALGSQFPDKGKSEEGENGGGALKGRKWKRVKGKGCSLPCFLEPSCHDLLFALPVVLNLGRLKKWGILAIFTAFCHNGKSVEMTVQLHGSAFNCSKNSFSFLLIFSLAWYHYRYKYLISHIFQFIPKLKNYILTHKEFER